MRIQYPLTAEENRATSDVPTSILAVMPSEVTTLAKVP